MVSNLLYLLARVDTYITYFTQDFIPLVTTLTDHPALIADPQAEKLFTKRFKADTLQIKALIECFPDISSPVRSCLETERREVDELNRSVTADRAKLETTQHTLNTNQQALRRREERLAADGRNLTQERTELESRKVTHDTQEKSVLDRIGKLLAASEASNEEESLAANEASYEARRALLEERERQSKATLSDLTAREFNIKALDESVKKRQREAADQLQKAQLLERAAKEDQDEFRKLLDQWEQKAIESFEAPCQRLQEEMLRQEQVHQAITTARQAKDLAERCGDIQNPLNQQEQVQQDTASKYELSVSAAVRELVQYMNNTDDARANRREEEIDWLDGLFSEVHADFAALVTLMNQTGEMLTRTVKGTAEQQ